MATEGIGAALSIDTKIMDDLNKAQASVNAMADAAEKLGKGFSTFKQSFVDTMNAANGKNFLASFDTSGVLKNLQVLTDAVAGANKQQQSASRSTVMSEESLNKKLENIFSKRADSYASISQRIKEIKDYQDKWNAANEASANKGAAAFDLKSYEAAGAYLEALQKRMENFRAEFNIGSAHHAEKLGLALDDSTYQGALMKIQSLAAAEKEMLKPGGMSAEYADWINRHLKLVQREIENTKAKLPELKKQAEDSLLSNRAGGVKRKFSEAIGVTPEDVEDITERMKTVQKAYAALSKEAEKNKFISPSEVEEAKKQLDDFKERLYALKMQAKADEASGYLKMALVGPEGSVDDIRAKIQEVELYIRHLKTVASSDADMSLIDNANGRLDVLRDKLRLSESSLRITSRAAADFGNILKGAFSTIAMGTILKNIIQIRGEFEMAERSIGIIIKDANMAKDIFNQIQNIAIKSPFQIKDLVKQTKQLAAYRIETDKLVETTKMLGDISAGVGVDMNRLILAFGQVKATTYLKGTELRQFSEAGVNMLGGLADRFSDVQKRAVSTSEVLQMISKRMVSFEDVYAVLQRQTAAGGAFYKMQEKQAETLQGRISNLRDKMDVMYNDIGKSTQGIMVFFLNMIDAIIENYHMLEPIIAGALMFKVGSFLTSLSKSTKSIRQDAKALFSIIKSDGVKSLLSLENVTKPAIAAAMALGAAIFTIIKSATKLRRELKQAAKDSKEDCDQMISDFSRLARVIDNGNNSIDKRTEAFEELKAQFGSIIPLENQNIDTIKFGSDAYYEYCKAIRQTNAELLKENELLTVQQHIQEASEKRVRRIGRAMMNSWEVAEKYHASEIYSDSAGYKEAAFIEIQNKILSGKIDNARQAAEEFGVLMDKFYGYEQGTFKKVLEGSWEFHKVIAQFKKLFKELGVMENINERMNIDSDYGFSSQKLNEAINNVGEYKDAWMNFYKYLHDENGKEIGINPEFENNEAKLKLAAEYAVEKYREGILYAIKEGRNIATGQIGSEFGYWFTDSLGNGLSEIDKEKLRDKVESATKDIISDPVQRRIQQTFSELNEQYPNLATKFGTGSLVVNAGESLESFTKRLEEQKDAVDQDITTWEKYNNLIDNHGVTEEMMRISLGGTKDKLEEQSEALTKAIELFKILGIAVDGASGSTKDMSGEIRSFVNEVVAASNKLDELNSEGDRILIDKLSEMSKRLKIALPKSFDDKTISAWVESLRKKLGDEYFDIKLTMNADSAEKSLESIRKKEEELWDKYNMAKRMKEYGISIAGYDADAIFSEIASIENDYRALLNKDGADAADELKKKRLDILRQEQEEGAKMIYEAQKKSSSKIQQIYQDMYEYIANMRSKAETETDYGKISESDIKAGIQGKIASSMRDVAEAEWGAYKATEMYTMSFGELDGLSRNVLEHLISQLEKFKASNALEPTEIKTVNNAISEMKVKLFSLSNSGIFGTIANGFSMISDVMRDTRTELPKYTSLYEDALKRQADSYAKLQEAKQAADANPEDDATRVNLEKWSADYENATKAASEAGRELGLVQKDLLRRLAASKKPLDDLSKQYSSVGDSISTSVGFVKEFADAMNLTINDETNEAIDGFVTGFGLVGSALAVVLSSMAAYNALVEAGIIATGTLETMLAPLLIAGAALGTIVAIVKSSDKALEKRVEAHKDAVEKLEKAYEDLEDRLQSVTSMTDAMSTYSGMMTNLTRQYNELAEAVDANNQRKQTEAVKDETEDLLEQMDEVQKKMKEANEQKLELLGAPTNYQDVANDWASSWLDSFKETGNGIDALKESFDSLYDDIVAGQLQSLVMGPALEKLKGLINTALDDFVVTDDEAAAIKRYRDEELAAISKRAEDLATLLGVTPGGFEGDTLQKGIEGVTEQTAQALESILNSTRYYVADNNRILQAIEQALTSEEGENTILSNMRAQTKYLKALSTIADAVYYSGSHRKGAGGIKVFVD